MMRLLLWALVYTVGACGCCNLLGCIPFLSFLRDNFLLQQVIVCVVTFLLMLGRIERREEAGPERLPNGQVFVSDGHQLLSTLRDGSNRIIRSYANSNALIVTTVTETRMKRNTAKVFISTGIMLFVYLSVCAKF